VTYLEPALPLLLLLGYIGIAGRWRRAPRPWLELVSLTGITLLSTQAFACVLAWPLEREYRKVLVPQQPADAIVVLSGTVSAPTAGRPYAYPGADTYRRVQHALFLFRSWERLPILVTGGGRPDSPHAEAMRRVLEAEGVPADMIWTETRAANTHENAIYSAEILRSKGVSRVALVVEANSMTRAILSFRKNGIDVVPAANAFTQLGDDYTDWWPAWQGIRANGTTIHEMVGLVWYWLRGWI
jgi:uncharacterized SAM-binding protein YcdF (DUF218 family)